MACFSASHGKTDPSSGGDHASLRNALLSRIRGAGRSAVRRAQARSRIAVGQPGPERVAWWSKHVVRLTATGAKAASLHLRYIERDGVEKDGSPGVLYDASGPARSEAFEQPCCAPRHPGVAPSQVRHLGNHGGFAGAAGPPGGGAHRWQ
jgi:hypothetical protein